MAASSSSSRKITLVSNDNQFFEVDEIVASQSRTVRNMIEDIVDENTFSLPNVDGKTLSKVLEYCKKHAESPMPSDEDLKAFDSEFTKLDQSDIFEILLAVNYMDIKELLDLLGQSVADLIKDMSVEDIRKTFNIENDFTPEEEEAIRKENEWAFET